MLLNRQNRDITTTGVRHWSDYFTLIGACGAALQDARTHDSFVQWWHDCTHGDWIAWLVARVVEDRRFYVWHLAECCRLLNKPAVGVAAEAVQLWVKGEASLQDVRTVCYTDTVAVHPCLAYVVDVVKKVEQVGVTDDFEFGTELAHSSFPMFQRLVEDAGEDVLKQCAVIFKKGFRPSDKTVEVIPVVG